MSNQRPEQIAADYWNQHLEHNVPIVDVNQWAKNMDIVSPQVRFALGNWKDSSVYGGIQNLLHLLKPGDTVFIKKVTLETTLFYSVENVKGKIIVTDRSYPTETSLDSSTMAMTKEPKVLKRYPLGEVPEQIEELTGVPETPMPVLRGTEARRTSPQYDGLVRHLGYEPVDSTDSSVPTDVQIIEDSQRRLSKVKVIPEHELTEVQRAHLLLARALSSDISPGIKKIQAADIPPASDRVRTAGLYGRSTREIFISPDQLNRGQTTIHTTIHELAHDTSGKEDAEETHNLEIARIAGSVVSMTAERRFDKFIAAPGFQW